MKKKGWTLLAADVLLAMAVLAVPGLCGWMLRSWPECWVRQYGLLCPACGGTRCVNFLIHGQLFDALQVNGYVCLLILYGMVLWILLHLQVFFRVEFARKAVKVLCRPVVVAALFMGFAVFGVARNFL